MAIVAAAAFLSAAMKAPYTGTWLLIEFSAQGVWKEDLFAALKGDFSRLVKSKLAIGMLLPMVLAVFGSMVSFNWWMSPGKKRRQPKMKRRSSSHLARNDDLDLRADWEQASKIDNSTRSSGFSCFRIGLLTNTFFTVVAATIYRRPHMVSIAAYVGTLVSAIASIADCCYRLGRRRTSWAGLGVSGQVQPFLSDQDPSESVRRTMSSSTAWTVAQVCRDLTYTAGLGTFGATIPLMPWKLKLAEDPYEAIAVSILVSVLATAQAATIDAHLPYGLINLPAHKGLRRLAVARQAATACAVGLFGVVVGELYIRFCCER